MHVTRHPYEVEGWGVGEVWACGTTLVQHELASEALAREAALAAAASGQHGPCGGEAHSPAPPYGGARRPARTLPPDPSREGVAFVTELCRRVAEHLRGVKTTYDDVELDLDWATPLQRELVAAARAVPWGEVVSYGELAALAGRPGAARAAGTFCAENRFSLVIPCHRVVAANGIGGYGPSGVGLKRRLLALEGVHL
jgi:methylated-DNA-[protein]-cysteine S-methyltransferase